jgi:hypothetical protein
VCPPRPHLSPLPQPGDVRLEIVKREAHLPDHSARHVLIMFVFFGLITSALGSATLDVLVNASRELFCYDPAATRNAPK